MKFQELKKSQVKKLGKFSDHYLAKTWGTYPATVGRWRDQLGIPAYVQPSGPPDVGLLGKKTDKALAELWGVNESTVCRWRISRGIPPRKTTKAPRLQPWGEFFDDIEAEIGKRRKERAAFWTCPNCGSKKYQILVDEEGATAACQECDHRWAD